MYKDDNNNYIYSPSDLTTFMQSPFASWMNRFAIDHPDKAPKKDTDDALMQSLQQKGYAHEEALEAELRRAGKSIIKIAGATNHEKYTNTLAAMRGGVDVIVQARLTHGEFAGFADFLVKQSYDDAAIIDASVDGTTLANPTSTPAAITTTHSTATSATTKNTSKFGAWHYEVWDTKLAKSVKPTFIVQLCCYADMLHAIQGVLPTTVTVVLGDSTKQVFKTADYFAYYRHVKADFLAAQASFNPNNQPNPAHSSSYGNWGDYANQLLLDADHLSQIAGISKSQIKKINQAGITKVQQLIDEDPKHIKGINPIVLKRLIAQADIQKQSERKLKAQAGSKEKYIPAYKVLLHPPSEKIGLALLPPHSPQDVFFDIEGYPLVDGVLEYLWGNTYFNAQGKRAFKDFWAHDASQEKQCFKDFIGWVYGKWQQDPTMHIYHYANYEIAACRKLMGRYGVCEHELDQLLRNEVFVDLYKVVKGGLLLGTPNYSIKSVELLFRGKRDTDVGTGGDSIVVYERWMMRHAAGEEGDTWQTSPILKDIRDYNIDDCNSTQELVVWLRTQQAVHGIDYLGSTQLIEPEPIDEITQIIALRDTLLTKAQNLEDVKLAKLYENLAWMLEFHRREKKPVYWRLFERLGLTDTELLDDLDCLACCTRTQTTPFKPSVNSKKLVYEYAFDPSQAFKGTAKNYFILGFEDDDGKRQTVSIEQAASDLDNGIVAIRASNPPATLTLVPDEIVHAKPIPQAIFAVAEAFALGELTGKKSAIIDFLTRAKPRIKNHLSGSIVHTSSDDAIAQIIHAVKNLDNSYLPIQGAPGAGKTYTGKHIIAELVKQGARVGISSNSHKAINNLLISTAKHCQAQGIKAHIVCTKHTDDALTALDVTITNNGDLKNHLNQACVLGTTAWGFARDDMVDALDYLFIDEAGQVASANLVAMSRATKNLVLMGDQMQLGQPSQGTHPAESGLSILDYLLHDTPTIADDMGVFLGKTYRMHSAINALLSQHVYDGKLGAHEHNDKRIIEVPNPPSGVSDAPFIATEAGLVYVPVKHEGNTQAADEEVAVIAKLAASLLGRVFHTGVDGETRAISWADMLFVAPYNHQVSKLKAELGEAAKVGSVDKFQGQEAPIVFLSMCASDASESPRGLSFLFDKHRLNVALSRAQTLAVVIASPTLGNVNASSCEQLKLVNLFHAIVQGAKCAE